jgi:hypothetical protein
VERHRPPHPIGIRIGFSTHVHIGLLRTIKDYDVGCQEEDGSSGGGYTGDVCNEKTWTECLDHYLSRTHKMKVGAFVGANYYRLSNNERLDRLDILVHDCLDTKVIRGIRGALTVASNAAMTFGAKCT